jgi:hypothetical protein
MFNPLMLRDVGSIKIKIKIKIMFYLYLTSFVPL